MRALKKYEHVFFDLDSTLWDFNRCSTEVLSYLYYEYKLYELEGLDEETFIAEYRRVNLTFWTLYEKGQIDKETIRSRRFSDTLSNLGYKYSDAFDGIEQAYIDLCPRKPHVISYAHDVLKELSANYKLHIITNGFSDTQIIKLQASRLLDYFAVIVTSDCGYQKPDARIFSLALEQACSQPHQALMIGDNLIADVAGARQARIDQVFFNPDKLTHNEEVTHEIGCLSELLKIL